MLQAYSHELQRILLQNTVKEGLQLFIADWLSRPNHVTNRDDEISGMY